MSKESTAPWRDKEIRRIGILGAGRLGKVLAARLHVSHQVAIYDVDEAMASRFARGWGMRFLAPEDLLDFADALLLCVPAPEIVPFLRQLPRERARHPLYLNLATAVDTPALLADLGRPDLRVIGLKLVGQFAAIAQGLPALFITGHSDPADLEALSRSLCGLGALLPGEESLVGPLNREATRQALLFAERLAAALQPLCPQPQWLDAALHSVAVGTLIDWPPSGDNQYTAEILRERAALPDPPRAKDPPRAQPAVVPDTMIRPFSHFGGRHCETSALRKVLRHHGVEYSEELLFGLGGGIGFIYWQDRRMAAPFIGGRNGKFPEFIQRVGEAVGQRVELIQTSSARLAYERLRAELRQGNPTICYGDIYHLPYFHVRRHFGGHAFVVYGLDEPADVVYISDRGCSPRIITRGELARARGSSDAPFQPRNTQLRITIDPSATLRPQAIRQAIGQTCAALLRPPRSNFGLDGLHRFGERLSQAIEGLPPPGLLDLLLSSYVNLELAGTGGCAFRDMYRGFLLEVRERLAEPALDEAIAWLDRSIEAWRRLTQALLPPLGPCLEEVHGALHAKERAFEQGTDEELKGAGCHVRRIEELWGPASAELHRGRAALLAISQPIADIYQAETRLCDVLARVAAP